MDKGDLFKAAYPRTDLNVVVGGVPLEPEGVTSWFILRPDGKSTRLTGDIVLLDREVAKATAEAIRNGLEITGLYSPFLDESPGIKRLSVEGKGAKSSLAWAAKLILSSTGTPLDPPEPSSSSKDPVGAGGAPKSLHPFLDWSKTQAILGSGEIEGRTLRFELPSTAPLGPTGPAVRWRVDGGRPLFLQKAEGGHIAAMGTFVLGPEEVDSVMESLARHHITVTSFRNQGTKDGTRFFFLNFWVVGEEKDVAEGLKDALDQAGLTQDP